MDRKIGLVLSGGGAKGAYEVGVWKALDEMGIVPFIDGIYGTSVGALNAVLFDTCSIERAEKIWMNLKKEDFFSPGKNKEYDSTSDGLDVFKIRKIVHDIFVRTYLKFYRIITFPLPLSETVYEKIEKYLSLCIRLYMARIQVAFFPYTFLFSRKSIQSYFKYFFENGLPITQNGINELIKDNVDFSLQKRQIVAFCMQSEDPHYVVPFDLQKYDFETRRRILLASSAMPIVYQGKYGIKIDETGYFDGGTDLRLLKIGPGEKTPISPMVKDGWKHVICIWLDQDAKPEPFSNTKVVNIIPSSYTIGKFWDGTIKVEPKKIKQDITMGYKDTMAKEAELKALVDDLS